ncbi:Serine/threonine-protein kinase B [Andreprevotia sp. IGB-42]|uniref:GNAT family N-acetyltransferase n=1 Tax=Andreprevotia sp. IGB-42 TaxID=2497473 RepID=UPI0013595C9E|nr:GNAT family N-acetyltransferase [Andreprevotia sp. IGB-42]KAF0815402.1 Serine/threonine-protein kinase B [Andreprevotia sp. IGB-42]
MSSSTTHPASASLQAVTDADALCALFARIVAHEASHWLGGRQPFIPDHHKPGMQRYQAGLGAYYKIMLAGAVQLTHSGREHARIELFYLDPVWQGRGLGGQVLQLLEAHYPQVSTWSLDTTRHSARNLAFYRKHGYVLVGEDDDEYYLRKQRPVDGASAQRQQYTADLAGTGYRDCTLSGADFFECNLAGVQISSSGMAGLTVQNANVTGAVFNNVNLSGARIGNARLDGVRLCNVSLGGAQFSDSNLGWNGEEAEPVSMQRCDLRNARLTDCDLRGAALNGCQLDGASIDGIPVSTLLAAWRHTVQRD